MEKVKINIPINGTMYELYIEPRKEPLYRQAARDLEKTLVSLKANWKISKGDFISIAAFILCYSALENKQSSLQVIEVEMIEDLIKKLDSVD